MEYIGLSERLTTLWLRARTAFVLHAANPRVLGNDAEYRRVRAAAYEVGCLLAERNPVFAATLLDNDTTVVLAGPGVPLLPTGTLSLVDADGAGTVTVALLVAGVTLTVTMPNGTVLTPAVVAGNGRTSATFPALVDGLYTVRALVGGTALATLLVPVYRSQVAALRENSRAARYAFRQQVPAPTPEFTSRLARLYGAEALARLGNRTGYAQLIASAAAIAGGAAPIAIFPSDHA